MKGRISRDDFVYLIGALPNWKAPWDDEISNEILKASPPWVLNQLHSQVNEIPMGGALPAAWKVGVVKLLQKKSPASDLGNQRPVCCVCMVYKLVSAVVNNRTTKLLECYGVLEEQQEGF